MSKYQKLFLLVIALAIAAGLACIFKPINRGLDIAGGLRVVMQVDPKNPSDWPSDPKDREDKMATIRETIVKRVGGIGGVTEPIVRVENASADRPRLVVELPGVKDTEQAKKDLINSASLDFYYMKDVQSSVNPLAKWSMVVSGEEDRVYTFTGPRGEVLSSQEGKDEDKNKEIRNKILEQVVGASTEEHPNGVQPELTGKLLLGNAKSAVKSTTNEPIIEIEFNEEGTKKFGEFTKTHVNEILGVFYDGALLTAPKINEPITDGKAIIEGFKSLKEATRIAGLLNAGALPVPLKYIAQDTVEPSLGTRTVSQVLMAGIAGLILVLLFMALYYRLPGVLAGIALALYALFTIAVFKVLGVTLSLAGFAALIISIGMAVDANILIFERLKEELKSGKTLRAAIDAGFNRAFTAIFDSNMCTAITCAILMWFGTASVKSFGFTLLLGVAISMFTAITVTRTFLHLLVNWEWAQNPKLYGLSTGHIAESGWDIVGKRAYYFLLSGILIVPGVFVLATSHLKPGIEFTSGTTIQASFEKPVSTSDVLAVVDNISPDSQVQMVEKGKTAFITTKLLSENTDKFRTDMNAIRSGLDEKFHLVTKDAKGDPTFDSVTSVGPTISKELTSKAFQAVVFASAIIVLYLSFRFAIGGFVTGLKYGTCAVIALLHDALFILGGFAIMGKVFGWETDSLFVTAVLTIIGFSVHDTIVVFDRIRENLRHRQRGESFEQLANRSILQTLSRSINTSFTVVLTLVTLVIFGGPILRHFYITLLAGIIIGTYSSIFNATPLVIVWDKLGEGSKTPRRRAVEEKPMVESAPSNGSGTEADVESAMDKTTDAAKAARPKRKKKRF